MSTKNNVLPFPVKMDATIIEFRHVVSQLMVLEAQMHKMLAEIDEVEALCMTYMDKRDAVLEELKRKELIDLAMEVVQNKHDD